MVSFGGHWRRCNRRNVRPVGNVKAVASARADDALQNIGAVRVDGAIAHVGPIGNVGSVRNAFGLFYAKPLELLVNFGGPGNSDYFWKR